MTPKEEEIIYQMPIWVCSQEEYQEMQGYLEVRPCSAFIQNLSVTVCMSWMFERNTTDPCQRNVTQVKAERQSTSENLSLL